MMVVMMVGMLACLMDHSMVDTMVEEKVVKLVDLMAE
jgi:hypothetical protein